MLHLLPGGGVRHVEDTGESDLTEYGLGEARGDGEGLALVNHEAP